MPRSPVWVRAGVVALCAAALACPSSPPPPAPQPDLAQEALRALGDPSSDNNTLQAAVRDFGGLAPQVRSAAVPRVRAWMDEELAHPTPQPHNDDCPPPPPCQTANADCLPRAAFLMLALESTGEAGRPAADEMMKLSARNPKWLGSLGQDIRAAMGDESLATELVEQLNNPDVYCRWHAANSIARLGPAATKIVPQLDDRIANGDWFDRSLFARVAGQTRSAIAAPVLEAALDSHNYRTQASAAEALGQIGAASEKAVARLRTLSTTHWSGLVRSKASAALTTLGQTSSAAAVAVACDAKVTEDAAGADAATASGALKLARVRGASHESTGRCRGLDEKDAAFAQNLDGDCLVGIDRGEHGGALELIGSKGKRTLTEHWYDNPLREVTVGKQRWVLEGISHLGTSNGRIVSLERRAGAWAAEPFVELPGEPFGFAVEKSALVIATRAAQASPEEPCGEVRLLRVATDGTVSAVR